MSSVVGALLGSSGLIHIVACGFEKMVRERERVVLGT
jgi:hypothetical protein